MRNGPFLLFSLALFSAYACGYLWLRGEIRGDDRVAQSRIAALERSAAREKLSAELARFELVDWQQYVAVQTPLGPHGSYLSEGPLPARELASVAARDAGGGVEFERGTTLFERAKEDFRERKFDSSGEAFKALLDKFPSSRHGIEARFLLAESKFQIKDYAASVDVIEELVDIFPESPLTGFALIRLGQIFELQDRRDDAVEAYRAVLAAYSGNTQLVTQARAALKKAAL